MFLSNRMSQCRKSIWTNDIYICAMRMQKANGFRVSIACGPH